ncbi:hypothetical protein [Micromonospora sp. CA-244673]|uniref:hypothetical protein n=1 Tax=Micromonospora sp. CA-244673 TaxID=3239958 RepID=UPI003D8A2B0A
MGIDTASTGGNHRQVRQPGNGFEWWYLQATSRDFYLTLVCHLTSIPGNRADEPYVSGTLLTQANGVEHVRAPAWFNSDGRGYLKASEYVEETAAGWSVQLSFPKTYVEIVVERLSDPWRTGNRSLIVKCGDDETHWSVPMPYARFRGRAHQMGRASRVSGWAYQDHNWGTAPLLNFFDCWDWAAASGPSGTWVSASASIAGQPQAMGVHVGADGRMKETGPAPWNGPRRGDVSRIAQLPMKRTTYRVNAATRIKYDRDAFEIHSRTGKFFGIQESLRQVSEGLADLRSTE